MGGRQGSVRIVNFETVNISGIVPWLNDVLADLIFGVFPSPKFKIDLTMVEFWRVGVPGEQAQDNVSIESVEPAVDREDVGAVSEAFFANSLAAIPYAVSKGDL